MRMRSGPDTDDDGAGEVETEKDVSAREGNIPPTNLTMDGDFVLQGADDPRERGGYRHG